MENQIIEILQQKGIKVDREKLAKIVKSVEQSISATEKALRDAGVPKAIQLADIHQLENDVSWSFSFSLQESCYIN